MTVTTKVGLFDWVKSVLPAEVKAYADFNFCWKVGDAIECNFTVLGSDEEMLLHFHSQAHIELFCESCQRTPDLIEGLFKKRMVK